MIRFMLLVVIILITVELLGVNESIIVPTAAATVTPTATATITPTATPTRAATATLMPPTATLAPPTTIQEPQPRTGGMVTALPLPANTSISRTGCASDGACYWFNFYWAPTREIVLQPGEGPDRVQHEYCHAHQHWSINGGAPLPPSDYDLESWYATSEGQSFMAATAGLSFPWTNSAINGLEDFAWTCTYWYLDPDRLVTVGGQARYEWMKENLP